MSSYETQEYGQTKMKVRKRTKKSHLHYFKQEQSLQSHEKIVITEIGVQLCQSHTRPDNPAQNY